MRLAPSRCASRRDPRHALAACPTKRQRKEHRFRQRSPSRPVFHAHPQLGEPLEGWPAGGPRPAADRFAGARARAAIARQCITVAPPVRHGSTTVPHGCAALHHGSTTVRHGCTALHHGSTTVRHGCTALHHGSTTVRHGCAALPHGCAALHHGSTTVHHGSTTVRHGCAVVRDRCVTVRHGSTAVRESSASRWSAASPSRARAASIWAWVGSFARPGLSFSSKIFSIGS